MGHWFISDEFKSKSIINKMALTNLLVSKAKGGFNASGSCTDIIMKPIESLETAFKNIPDTLSKDLFNQNFTFFFNDKVTETSYVPVFDIKEFPLEPQPYVQSYSDSYRFVNYMLPKIVSQYDHSLNKYSIFDINDNFKNGKFKVNALLNPINPRGNPIRSERDYYTLTSGYGLHYNALDRFQELQCLQERYFCKKSNLKFSYESDKLAREIADQFIKDCFEGDYSSFNDDEIYKVIFEYAQACRKKHYPSQVVGYMNHTTVRNVRFSMKNIFKPAKIKLDINKAGQGISAWSKDIQVMIGSVMRIITKHVANGMKPGIIFNNGLTEEQLMRTMNASFDKQSKYADTAVVDFTAYDATQNKFTQRIEQYILRKLGLDQYIIDIYYSFRENYELISSFAKGSGGMTKTSGEPATLLLNTLLAMALTNWICRGTGKFVMMGQGDDVIKRQMSINKVLATERIKILAKHVKIKMKLEINLDLEFCGFAIVNGSLIPSIFRKAKKLTGHRFRDYQHFCEYQTSLRDSLALIKRMGLQMVIAENANMLNTTYENAFNAYSLLQSFAHIAKSQFDEIFKKVTVSTIIPNKGKLLY